MTVHYLDERVTLHTGRAQDIGPTLVPGSVSAIVTSPPYYGLRDYGSPDQIGLEGTVGDYVQNLVGVFMGLWDALADDGTLWLNLGDTYASRGGHTAQGATSQRLNRRNVSAQNAARDITDRPAKNLLGVPWRVAFAMQDAGWILRSDVIWAKPNPMPESVTDRPTKSHEHLFFFAKSSRYFYDAAAIREPDKGLDHPRAVLGGQPSLDPSGGVMRPHTGLRTPAGRDGLGANKRDVWTVPLVPFPEAHFAVYPPELIRPCIRASARPGGVVLDPFSGSGTTGMVALQEGRRYIGIDTNPEYHDLALRTRLANRPLDFAATS